MHTCTSTDPSIDLTLSCPGCLEDYVQSQSTATPVEGYAHLWLQDGLYAFADETGDLHGEHPTIDDAVAAMQRYAASL